MTAEPVAPPRDEQLIATVRAVLSRRMHAAVDALLDDLIADVMIEFVAPDLTAPPPGCMNGRPDS